MNRKVWLIWSGGGVLGHGSMGLLRIKNYYYFLFKIKIELMQNKDTSQQAFLFRPIYFKCILLFNNKIIIINKRLWVRFPGNTHTNENV